MTGMDEMGKKYALYANDAVHVFYFKRNASLSQCIYTACMHAL